MRLWSRFCNLVPAIIVENILWSTLFLVGVLNVLTWIVFSSYLVSDKCVCVFFFLIFHPVQEKKKKNIRTICQSALYQPHKITAILDRRLLQQPSRQTLGTVKYQTQGNCWKHFRSIHSALLQGIRWTIIYFQL